MSLQSSRPDGGPGGPDDPDDPDADPVFEAWCRRIHQESLAEVGQWLASQSRLGALRASLARGREALARRPRPYLRTRLHPRGHHR